MKASHDETTYLPDDPQQRQQALEEAYVANGKWRGDLAPEPFRHFEKRKETRVEVKPRAPKMDLHKLHKQWKRGEVKYRAENRKPPEGVPSRVVTAT